MSENTEHPESDAEGYRPGIDPCPGCGEVHPPNNLNIDPTSVVRRVLTDEAGEEYVNVNDLRNFMQSILNAQQLMTVFMVDNLGADPDAALLGLQAMGAMALNVVTWNRQKEGEAPSSSSEVPDEIPSDWLQS